MKQALVCLIGLATACQRAPEREPDAPPDLLVVVVDSSWASAPSGPLASKLAYFAESQAIHAEPAPALRALLTGQWPGTTSSSVPNTVHSVLRLYGYRTVGWVPPHLAPAETPWLTAGLEQAPLSGRACLSDQLDAFARLHPDPSDVAIAGLFVSAGEDCDIERDQQALAKTLDGRRKSHLVTVVVGLSSGDWDDADGSPVPFFMAGPGMAPQATAGFASVVDLVPTLLPLAEAVVPSDAIGTDLRPVLAGQPGPDLVFQQDAAGRLGIRTRKHLLVASSGGAPLPETPTDPDGLTYLPLTDAPDTGAARTPLYTALVQWDRQRRATSAAERMGGAAFRKLLSEQGYWH